jgi:hypothetical protein
VTMLDAVFGILIACCLIDAGRRWRGGLYDGERVCHTGLRRDDWIQGRKRQSQRGRRHLTIINLIKAIGVCGVTAGWAGIAAATPSLCTPAEDVVFSCPLAKKLVSLCASDHLNDSVGWMTYRIGRAGQMPEMSYPEAHAHPKTQFRGGTRMYSGGGGAFVSFDRGRYTYTVFTAIGRGWGQKEGVVVEVSGRRVAYLDCRARADSVLGDDWFRRVAIPNAPNDFELP